MHPERQFRLNSRSGCSRSEALGETMTTTAVLTHAQRAAYDDVGFVRLPGFAPPELCEAMLDRVVDIARAHAEGEAGAPGLVLPEANLAGGGGNPEDLVAKVFSL